MEEKKKQHPIVVLWVNPRSRSTAVSRVFMSRGDFRVFDEPFGDVWHIHEGNNEFGLCKEEFAAYLSKHGGEDAKSYERIKQRVLSAAEEGPVFFKESAYAMIDLIIDDNDFLRRLTNTFLFRDPAETIPSYVAVDRDMSPKQVGLEDLWKLYEKIERDIVQEGDPPLVVMDSEDLIRDPNATLQTYCDGIGIEHIPESLQWEPLTTDVWKLWIKFYRQAAESTGIKSEKIQYKDSIHNNEKIRKLYELHLPYFEKIRSKKMIVGSS